MTTNNNNRVPQLRFPGFEGEWPIQPLSNFLHEHKTKSDGKCRVHSVSVSKGVVDQIEYLGRSFAASDTSKYNLAKPNDIIYTKSPTGSFPYGIVKMNKNPYNVIVSPLYGVYSPNNQYIGYIIDSFFESPERTNTYLSSLVQKGAKNTIQITNNTFISKNVCFPTDEAEQQKIADCLSSLDEEIAAEAQKADALKTHKKGLMQQLFPQPGQTTPLRRFPGFTGEWEEKKLGEVCEIFGRIGYRGYTKEDLVPKGNGAITFSPSDIHDQIIDYTDCSYISNYKYEESPEIKVFNGDIIFCKTASIGKCALISNLKEKATINPQFVVFKNFKCNNQFLYYIISGNDFQEKALSITAGSTIKTMSQEQLKQLSVFLPPTLAEQQKIADCLSELDEMISAQQQKVEALKEHKKGLMQKLFPKM